MPSAFKVLLVSFVTTGLLGLFALHAADATPKYAELVPGYMAHMAPLLSAEVHTFVECGECMNRPGFSGDSFS